jgi:hypothetical protein
MNKERAEKVLKGLELCSGKVLRRSTSKVLINPVKS